MTSSRIHHARCGCGALELTARGEPIRVSVCHCLDCQRRTGSVFGVQARFPADRVETSGESATWARTGDSGGTATFHFCPRCGSTVWYVTDGEPALVGVPVGALADPTFPAPSYSIYGDRRHRWVELPDGIDDLD